MRLIFYAEKGMTTALWKIWVDTGGTFTDCIAITPAAEKKRLKVLSSGCLRGRILEKTGPCQYLIQQNWGVGKSIFDGYRFGLVNDDQLSSTVKTVDLKHNRLELEEDLAIPALSDFEISSGEEAPVLAARMATEKKLHEPLPKLEMRIGSTKGTNALLEKKGAGLTLLITRGFRDLLEIGHQQRPHLFQLAVPPPTVLYDQVIEVEERVSATGEVIRPLRKQAMEGYLDKLKNEVVVVALMNAYRNPVHELQLKEALSEKGIRFVSLSHELTPTIKLLPRAQTALVNGYLSPVIQRYLEEIEQGLTKGSDGEEGQAPHLLVMTSSGGLVNSRFFQPKDSLLSGPAGGVVGAAHVAEGLGYPRILTLDMGGTSTDTARYDGRLDYQFLTRIDDFELASSSLAIETVAAGGGSICYFDGYKLQVGPESAGAHPGPACYGAGGPLTVTDVNLLLGKMDPTAIGIPIDLQAAMKSLLALRQEIYDRSRQQLDPIELLQGFERIANRKMADAIRKISVAKGINPSDYALLAFGGAGGLHACRIASILEMNQVILPFDGGLLSAWGIGNANVERLAERQINAPLKDNLKTLDQSIASVKQTARGNLAAEGLPEDQIEIQSVLVYLRLAGQSHNLELVYDKPESLSSEFERQYRDLFGYYPEGGSIEIESIKAIASTRLMTPAQPQKAEATHDARPAGSFAGVFLPDTKYPVYVWKDLKAGATLAGPSILVNDTSTAFLEPGWEAVVGEQGDVICKISHSEGQVDMEFKEAIELELFTNQFIAIANEMGAQLQRTAFSVNIKERLDFSCALLDGEAQLLVNAPHIPVHLGSLGICARLVLEKLTIGPGDVVITNHPKYGGSHLPDITLLSGVFTDAGDLIGYVINRAHHAELGGKQPGSMPPDATTLEEEGVVIPPTYLVRQGAIDWEKFAKVLTGAKYPTRSVQENLADVKAALASLRNGERGLKAMVNRYGLQKVRHYMAKLKEISRLELQKELSKIDGKSYKATELLDDDHAIVVKVEVKQGRITFYFDGTSQQHQHNLNANLSIVYSAILYVLRLLCSKDIPLNGGLMELVEIQMPNCFLNPEFADDPAKCPAVVGGNTEVSQRLVDTLLKALGLAACSQGTMNNLLFGNDRFGYYETIGGGIGAVEGAHGRSATHQHMTNTKITDPEELEWKYPVRLHRFEIRRGSGGAGQWNGGDGIVRELEFLEEVEMTILSQHRKVAPYGVHGGNDGQTGQQYIIRADGWREYIEGVDARRMFSGERIIVKTPGGGAWGTPPVEVQET